MADKVSITKIEEELGKVMDPELGMSIMELNLIDKLHVSEEGGVDIEFHLTAPFCPPMFALKIAQDIKAGVSRVEGVKSVKLNLTQHYLAEYVNKSVNAQ